MKFRKKNLFNINVFLANIYIYFLIYNVILNQQQIVQ